MTDVTTTKWKEYLLLHTTCTKGSNGELWYTYAIECTTFKQFEVTLDFSKSENFKMKGKAAGVMEVKKIIAPNSKVIMATIERIDQYKKASRSMRSSYIEQTPDEHHQQQYMSVYRHRLTAVLQAAEAAEFPSRRQDPHGHRVTEIATAAGIKFVDLAFPPVDTSLLKGHAPIRVCDMIADLSHRKFKDRTIEWRRPEEFLTGEVKLFDGIDPNDIHQGALGDCWFLSSIASLSQYPVFITDLFDRKEETVNPAGVYSVRFCQNGRWRQVRIDDFIPCKPNGDPIFSQTKSNELWVMLLEKTFAKLCGSYEAIQAGQPSEAMMDMTGAPCQVYDFEREDVKRDVENGTLWRNLVAFTKEKYIMTASTRSSADRNSTGLVPNHAYTLLRAVETSHHHKHKLVKLRNPWGCEEWKGDWCDASPLWTHALQTEVERLVNEDDGVFWMSFEDFLRHFDSTSVCLVRHPSIHPVPWSEERKHFHYSELPLQQLQHHHQQQQQQQHQQQQQQEQQLQGMVGPAYEIHVRVAGTFLVSIHQEDCRCEGARTYSAVGVCVLQELTAGEFRLLANAFDKTARQNQTPQFDLQPGRYIVVPTTTGNVGHAAFSHRQSGALRPLIELDFKNRPVFTPFAKEALRDLFTVLDVTGDGFLSAAEMKVFAARLGKEMTDVEYEIAKNTFGRSTDTGISPDAFVLGQQQIFLQQHSGTEAELRHVFRTMGFGDDLKLSSGLNATLAVHGATPTPSKDFSVKRLVNHTSSGTSLQQLAETAVTLPLVMNGERKVISYHGDDFELFHAWSGSGCVTYAVRNPHAQKTLHYMMNCGTSANMESHRGDMKIELEVLPGQTQLLHRLVSTSETRSCTVQFTHSYRFE